MLRRLSIRYKIGFIALIGLIGFVIFQTASYRLSIDIRDQLQNILTEDFTVLKFTNDIQVGFAEVDKLYQAALAEADTDTLLEADARATQLKLRFDLLRNNFDIQDPFFLELQAALNDYTQKTSRHTLAVLNNTLTYEETLEGYADIALLRERYKQLENRFIEKRYELFEQQLISIENDEAYLVQFGLVLGLVLSVLLVLFSVIIIQRLIMAFSNAVNVAEEIAGGNLDQEIHVLSEDETGKLMQSLTAMRDALKKQNEDNVQREKTQGFLAGLNERMRGDKSLEELVSVILEYLSCELHAQLGAFYLFEKGKLVMQAGYAYPLKETQPVYALGESVIGQVGLEQKPRIINDLPDDYVTVGSGIGKAQPRSILLFPLVYEGKLKGLIEIAAFRRFSEDDVFLIKRCNDAISISLDSAQSRVKLAGMLKQTQEQAHELKRQRQELALFNQQLEEKTEDLDRQKNEVLEKNIKLERSEKALIEKSRALELSGKYKSQFLSTMSHELRTPLNSILLLSDALMENRNGKLDEQDIEHARVIHNAGSDLLTLINDILDLSKVEEGKMDIIIDAVQVDNFAQSLREQFEYQAREKGLEFNVETQGNLPATFYTDRHRLKQIVKNFISNAIKFTEEGGVYITIEKPESDMLDVSLPSSQAIAISVRDTGVGIDKSKQHLVFEAFKQADGTTSRKYGGTGLGLTISRELARLLGGEITLESGGDGKGSVFTLYIPVGNENEVSERASKSAETSFTGLPAIKLDDIAITTDKALIKPYTVSGDLLIISDDELLSQAMLQASEKLELLTHAVNSFEQAFTLLESQDFETVYVHMLDDSPSDFQKIEKLLEKEEHVFVSAETELKERLEQLGVTYLGDADNNELIEECLSRVRRHKEKTYGEVLIVEDNQVFQEVIRKVFKKNHILFTIASDGKEALELIDQKLFDCLVVDLNLPDISGLELLKNIRERKDYKHQTILVFTAEDLGQERQQDIHQYADKLITKTPKAIIDICDEVKRLTQSPPRLAASPEALITPSHVVNYQQGLLDKRTVLLVDDDERNLYSITAALETEQINVIKARSGMEALEILQNTPSIDIVLLDIMMPEMDGYEVLRKIRSDQVLRHLPVIALTAKAMVGDREKCFRAGASDYLSKPVEVTELLTCIATHIFHSDSVINS